MSKSDVKTVSMAAAGGEKALKEAEVEPLTTLKQPDAEGQNVLQTFPVALPAKGVKRMDELRDEMTIYRRAADTPDSRFLGERHFKTEGKEILEFARKKRVEKYERQLLGLAVDSFDLYAPAERDRLEKIAPGLSASLSSVYAQCEEQQRFIFEMSKSNSCSSDQWKRMVHILGGLEKLIKHPSMNHEIDEGPEAKNFILGLFSLARGESAKSMQRADRIKTAAKWLQHFPLYLKGATDQVDQGDVRPHRQRIAKAGELLVDKCEAVCKVFSESVTGILAELQASDANLDSYFKTIYDPAN